MAAAIVAEIAELLAKGLVSGIASATGARIFNSIFQTGVPSYFTEAVKEIEKFMHQEITKNIIDEIDGEINGLKDWVKNVYVPRKDSGASNRDLFNLMVPKESDIAIHMISVLQEKAFAESSMSVFVIGASMHLVILQELAFVDPDASDPFSSSYVDSIKKYASEYAEYAEKECGIIITTRTSESNITAVASYTSWVAFVTTYVTEWWDYVTGEHFVDSTRLMCGKWTNGTDSELLSRSVAKRLQHLDNVREKLSKDLNNPAGVSETWRQLIDQPLPVQ